MGSTDTGDGLDLELLAKLKDPVHLDSPPLGLLPALGTLVLSRRRPGGRSMSAPVRWLPRHFGKALGLELGCEIRPMLLDFQH